VSQSTTRSNPAPATRSQEPSRTRTRQR
jgi:hypothetical protein